jgi:hypothetical protein
MSFLLPTTRPNEADERRQQRRLLLLLAVADGRIDPPKEPHVRRRKKRQ